MPRQFYTDDDRMIIFVSTTESRRNELSWAEALTIAKKAGFKGGVPALQVFIKNQRKKNKKTRLETNKRIREREKAKSQEGKIEAAIQKLVKDRVRTALTNAIEVLNSAM